MSEKEITVVLKPGHWRTVCFCKINVTVNNPEMCHYLSSYAFPALLASFPQHGAGSCLGHCGTIQVALHLLILCHMAPHLP